MALGRVEAEELTRAGIDRLVSSLDLHPSADDEEERGLGHLVVVQLLPRRELDQDNAALTVLRMEHGG